MLQWGDKRYHSLTYHLRGKFGSKVVKIPLDAGFTCPNRDGRLGMTGCLFCSERGSGDFAGSRRTSVRDQIAEGITAIQRKYRITRFIAYFQAFTNTYAPVDSLRALYEQALECDEVVGIAIATRPDCLDDGVLSLLEELNSRTCLWVELGLQTIHESTAELIQRRFTLHCFDQAVNNLSKLKIDTVCHTILGLPHETPAMMVETAQYLAEKRIQGIKLQLLHVLKGTGLARMYKNGAFSLMDRNEYVRTVVDCLEVLPPETVVHRLTGDGPKELLVGPMWSTNKIGILQAIEKELLLRDTWQGKRWMVTG